MDERTRKHINDDKETSHIEKSNHTPEKKKGLTKTQKIIATGIILVALVGGGLAYNIYNNSHNTNSSETSSNSSQTTTPEKPVLSALEQLTETYGAAMEKYKDMSIDTFESLPRDERLLYSQYLIDQTVASGFYDRIYANGGPNEASAIKPTTLSSDSNGQEIINNSNYIYQISAFQYTSAPGTNEPVYNVDSGVKILSSVYYSDGKDKGASSIYLGVKSAVEAQTTFQALPLKYTATDTSDLLTGKDVNGETIQYKIVTFYTESAKTLRARFILHPFTDYDGTRKVIGLFDKYGNTVDELNISN